MEADTASGARIGLDLAAVQTNGRFTSPLVINSASRRRSLFSRPRSADNSAPSAPAALGDSPQLQSPNPAASSEPKQPSPNNTRIPRSSQQRPSQPRRPFTLSDAYRMAEEEEAAQASPSPAPRSWRSRRESGDGRPQRKRNTKPAGLRREDTASSVDSLSTQSRRSDVSESDFDEKLRQHALDRPNSAEDPVQRTGGLFSRSKLGIKISETAKELARKTSRNSLDGDSPSPRVAKPTTNNNWLSRRLSAKKSEPSNRYSTHGPADAEQDQASLLPGPLSPGVTPPGRLATVPPDYRSPEKSFAWQADADFTAGDLQASNSPPVGTGRSNTKIDEIRSLEAEVGKQALESPQLQTRNTRIDEIRALEVEAVLRLADESPDANDWSDGGRDRETEREGKPRRNWQTSSANTKVDELRAREIESLSRRALATARLDEIRERNAGYRSSSRSPSPELRTSSKELLGRLSPDGTKVRGQERSGNLAAGEMQQPPIDEAVILDAPGSEVQKSGDSSDDAGPGLRLSQLRNDSRNLLRRLALAASTSPTTEQQAGSANTATSNQPGTYAPRQKKLDGAKADVRPTVGFAGLRRDSSVESFSDKRSDFAHSDSDPTERIEGEMKLFAPLENHSERGSLRAPSPAPEEEEEEEEADEVEATPRPTKTDPSTQPTPRVVGAFVETPATIKVEKWDDLMSVAPPGLTGAEMVPNVDEQVPSVSGVDVAVRNIGVDASASTGTKPSLLRGRKHNASLRNPRQTLSARGDKMLGRSSSVSGRRRSKSLPRTRSPLINSAKPPTVKDDLLEIQRANQFEDSTLDDLADLLGEQESDDPVPERRRVKPEHDASHLSERQKELEAYDRMSKSLRTGLLGIRTAKQGIERLEDKVSHAEANDLSHSRHSGDKSSLCPACRSQSSYKDASTTYSQLPFPRLWQRHPRFRFTLAGLALFLLSFWYIVESSMCYMYCKPRFCFPSKPCEWSPDDPLWGYSIPVKLDQWLMGGHGRTVVSQVQPELAAWFADIWDAATGVDSAQINTSRYGWNRKQYHRRQLLKKGLVKPSAPRPEDEAKFAAWRAARLAAEKAKGAREMGYSMDDDDSMADDERL